MRNKPIPLLILALFSSCQVMADPLTVTTLAPDKPVAGAPLYQPGQVQPQTLVTPDPLAQPGPIVPAIQAPATQAPTMPVLAKNKAAAKPASSPPVPSAYPVNKPVVIGGPVTSNKLHITPIKQAHKKAPPAKSDGEVAPFFDIPESRGEAVSAKEEKPKPVSNPYEITLPGLGKINGDPMLMKAVVLRVNGDGTEVVQVSSQFQNRISTPFETPKIIDSSDTEFKISGSNIFLSTPSDHPVVVYVTGSERNDPVLSLTLIPKPIPAQTIILQLDPSIAVQSSPKGHHEHKPETYEQHLAGLLKTLASGDTPEGFTTGNISNIVGRKGPMIINPVSRYSNAYLDIFVYQAQNAGNPTINLSETSFYQKGVRAVGMYPLSTLQHAEKTYVYVISDKSALGAAK